MTLPPLNVWVIFGTRPEAIKMLPVVIEMKKDPRFNPVVCITAQHREMLDQVLEAFNVKADIDLDVMSSGQSLTELTSKVITRLTNAIENHAELGFEKPDRILVHGDTSTAFTSSLAGYYQRIPVGHVEAGLRTNNIYSPFPEEGNRKLVCALSDMHFTPTNLSTYNLIKENVPFSRITQTGNTVIDALIWMTDELDKKPELATGMLGFVKEIKEKHKEYILVTGHRRENHGEGFRNICLALREISLSKPDVAIVYPVHPNPKVSGPITEALNDLPNVYLIAPQDYAPFIYLMKNSKLILTDSGGVQEEAPSLGKPVLVMRDVTERQEALDAGTVKLVGADRKKIVSSVFELLENQKTYDMLSEKSNPYGDGFSSKRILDAIYSEHKGILNVS